MIKKFRSGFSSFFWK